MGHTFHYDDSTVVKTKLGKLRGYKFDDVYYFLGVQYAQARRFHAPHFVDPWDGVKDVVGYGAVCPTDSDPLPSGEVYIPHRFWPKDENCLNLNIWTTSLDPGAKKPVLIWFHGGGFADGSSIEQLAYDGQRLASYGDVVVVTVNHRLNIFGFLDMSSFGNEYENSANAGIADLVAALQWVHDNIAVFGGDPEKVTVAGQSGGGGKVQTLCQVPSAAGLFQRGIIMSGIHDEPRDSTIDHAPIVNQLLKELHIDREHVGELESIPSKQLIDAFNRVQHSLAREEHRAVVWGPKKNDWYLGDSSVNPMAEFSKDVPMIMGTVFGEFADRSLAANLERLSDDKRKQEMIDAFECDAKAVARAFAGAYPDRPACRALCLDTACRPATLKLAERFSRNTRSHIYVYLFAPIFQMCGPTESWHCSDIPFLFHNVDSTPYANCLGIGQKMQSEFGDSLLRFIKTGDPSKSGCPDWDAFNGSTRATMVFGDKPVLRYGFDDDLLMLISKHRKAPDMEEMLVNRALLMCGKHEWNY